MAVGTGGGTTYDRHWSLAEVLQAMDRGDRFYTVSASTNRIALVHKYQCSQCWKTHIRSAPDAVWDNNLDNLSPCAVRAATR